MNIQKNKNEYYNSYLYESSRIRFVSNMTSRKLTEEQKQRMSNSVRKRVWWTDGKNTRHCENCPGEDWYRGRPNINVGRVLSDETKKKIGKSNSGKVLSEEHKTKITKELKTRRWWNNGKIDKHCKDCPGPEWKLGRLGVKSKIQTEKKLKVDG